MKFSFFGTCIWVQVIHRSTGASGFFFGGELLDILRWVIYWACSYSARGLGGGCHCGPFYLTQVSTAHVGCLKATSTQNNLPHSKPLPPKKENIQMNKRRYNRTRNYNSLKYLGVFIIFTTWPKIHSMTSGLVMT